MKFLPILASCASLCLPLWAVDQAPATQGNQAKPSVEGYLRIQETPEETSLQTAIIHYEKGDQRVDLIGAIHIADASYYQALNEKFTKYDALLFELVSRKPPKKAGETSDATTQKKPEESAAVKDSPLKGLGGIYQMVASVLQLKDQQTGIDYTAKNFVHADLTLEEFLTLQKEHSESLGSLLGKVQEGQTPEQLAAQNAMQEKLVKDFMMGKTHELKRSLMKQMVGGMSSLSSVSDSVLIGKRNDRCLSVLEQELKKGGKYMGIFYGAAHFHDMGEKLEKLGFRRVQTDWLAAWTVRNEAPKQAPPAPAVKDAA